MSNVRKEARGLLLAAMEPPPAIEEEFQDWYDNEHFPERAAIAGFDTAHRFVCVDGWPRYLAVYDLADPGVLQGPGYAAVAGARYSAWTHRIMARVWGQYRAAGAQIFPGRARYGDNGACARLVVWRFRHVPKKLEARIVKGMRALYEGRPETAQLRVFSSAQPDGNDCLALVELRAAHLAAPLNLSLLGAAAQHVDTINAYVAYRRQSAGAFPATR